MSIINEYIIKCEEAMSSEFPEADRNELAREIMSGFQGRIPNIHHYRGHRSIGAADVHTIENIGQLRAKLLVLRDEQDRQISEKYGTFALDDAIRRCEKAMASNCDEDKAIDLCYEVAGAYGERVPGFQDYLWINGYESPSPKDHLPLIVTKLRAYKDQIIQEANLASAKGVNVVQHAEQNTQVSVRVSFEGVIEEIDAIPDSVLTEEDRDEAKRLAFDLKESAKKDRAKFMKVAKALFDWSFEKGLDKVPMLMDYLAAALRSLSAG